MSDRQAHAMKDVTRDMRAHGIQEVNARRIHALTAALRTTS